MTNVSVNCTITDRGTQYVLRLEHPDQEVLLHLVNVARTVIKSESNSPDLPEFFTLTKDGKHVACVDFPWEWTNSKNRQDDLSKGHESILLVMRFLTQEAKQFRLPI